MSRKNLSSTLQSLLPGEANKRIRQGILAAADSGSAAARSVKTLIDQENRVRTGKLASGTVLFTSPTSATLDLFAWVVDFENHQPGPTIITVVAPDSDFPREDSFTGNGAGEISYYPGSLDTQGNSFPANIPAGEVLLQTVIRHPNGDNDIIDSTPSPGDSISKSATDLQTIAGPLAVASLAGTIQDFIGTDPSGRLRKVAPARAGVYTTLGGGGGWSKISSITIDPTLQLNYVVTFQVLGVSPNYEKGEMWVLFRVDANGDIINNGLKLFGEFDADLYRLLKVDSTHYELYVNHASNDSLYSFRPIMLFGNDSRYQFFQESPITALPSVASGDQYTFSLAALTDEELATARGITRSTNPGDGSPTQYQFPTTVTGLPAVANNEFVTKGQLGTSVGGDNKVNVIYIDPDLLTGTGTEYERLKEYINSSFPLANTSELSKINIIVGIDPNPAPSGFPYTFPLQLS